MSMPIVRIPVDLIFARVTQDLLEMVKLALVRLLFFEYRSD